MDIWLGFVSAISAILAAGIAGLLYSRKLREIESEERQLSRKEDRESSSLQAYDIAHQLKLLSQYQDLSLRQLKSTYIWSISLAFVGLLLILSSVLLVYFDQPSSVVIMSLVTGLSIEIMSIISFNLYNKSASQVEEFRIKINETQQILNVFRLIEESDDVETKRIIQEKLVNLILKDSEEAK
jgi:hypothetical protein